MDANATASLNNKRDAALRRSTAASIGIGALPTGSILGTKSIRFDRPNETLFYIMQ